MMLVSAGAQVAGELAAALPCQSPDAATPVPASLLPARPATGVANPADAFTPSGALLKAVLLGGAASIAGFEADTGLPIDPPPSFRQGFGRVQLGALCCAVPRWAAPLRSALL